MSSLATLRSSALALTITVVGMLSWSSSWANDQVIADHCSATCGNLSIPYPFGIGEGCYLAAEFLIDCTYGNGNSSVPPKAMWGDFEVTKISQDGGEVRINTPVSYVRYNNKGEKESGTYWNYTFGGFAMSYLRNKFFAVGCDTQGTITSGSTSTGCMSICTNESIPIDDGSCSGIGCCQTSIPLYKDSYVLGASSFKNHTAVWDFNPCSYAFVAEENSFQFHQVDLFNLSGRLVVPTILDWTIGTQTCEQAESDKSTYACKENSDCVNATNGAGYRCNCAQGYQGNAYLPGGCLDVNECTLPNRCGEHLCNNTKGSYDCFCREGYTGTPNKEGDGCEKVQLSPGLPVMEVTVGSIASLTLLIIIASSLYCVYNKRANLLLKKKYFEQNGGLMLQRELSKKEGYNETARIFTANELKLATNYYDESRIIGQGGFGTVYKGIQKDDPENVIAIKKSKVMDQDQIEQFINEVIVLSQINHRNVVRLIGCCLETEVPLLVYEYINNGTLYEHLHEKKEGSEVVSWENRLRIAAEIAGVLAYLHSDAAVSIVHRDIKSTNILLDHNYIAKVSDFGASRLVPQDQDQLSTMVQGTMGYLDPEYLHTSLLTEKSDVYSFGVVLVELMTGKKALSFDRPEEERCLAMYFILSMRNNKLFSVVEDGLVKDGNEKQIEEVASLAMACLRVSGEDRPSMREVASELQGLLAIGKHQWEDGKSKGEEREHFLLGRQQLSDTDLILFETADCNTSVSYGSTVGHIALNVDDGR